MKGCRSAGIAVIGTAAVAIAAIGTATVATAAPADATAAANPPGIGRVRSLTVRYGTRTVDTPTALQIIVTGDPPAAGVSEAPALRQVIVLAPGTRLDTRGAVRCHATVAQLIASGAEVACPRRSRIGEGRAVGVLNGVVVSLGVGVYDFPGRLSFAIERDGAPLRQGFFGTVAGRRITIDTPTAGGTIAPKRFSFTIAPHRYDGHALFTTPARCPASGAWTIRSTFQALTAVTAATPFGPSQTLEARTRCRA